MEIEKKVEESTEETKVEGETETEESSSQNDTELDEAIKEEKTKAKAEERFEEKKREQAEEDNSEEKPLTRKEMAKLLADRDSQTRKELLEEKAIDYAKSLTESPKEAELILAVWRNPNRRFAGGLKEQLEEAQAIATSKRLKAKNEELKRALLSKDSTLTTGENGQKKPETTIPKLNSVDKTVVQGMVWDNSKQAYRKTIAGGRKLFFVSKDLRKRWTEDAPKK